MVTESLIKEFKDVMHITHNDKKIKGMLMRSIAYIKSRCGDFDIEEESEIGLQAKDLVFNRARYDYYESTDLFEDNYLSEITHLSLLLAGDDSE